MLKMLEFIGWFMLAILIFIGIQIGTAADSPCSAWSQHPEECSSDIFQTLGK
jgi:hypothetical protein